MTVETLPVVQGRVALLGWVMKSLSPIHHVCSVSVLSPGDAGQSQLWESIGGCGDSQFRQVKLSRLSSRCHRLRNHKEVNIDSQWVVLRVCEPLLSESSVLLPPGTLRVSKPGIRRQMSIDSFSTTRRPFSKSTTQLAPHSKSTTCKRGANNLDEGSDR